MAFLDFTIFLFFFHKFIKNENPFLSWLILHVFKFEIAMRKEKILENRCCDSTWKIFVKFLANKIKRVRELD
jgi:hypothetical protein